MILILTGYNFITIAFRLPFHTRASLIGIKIRFIVIISWICKHYAGCVGFANIYWSRKIELKSASYVELKKIVGAEKRWCY